MPPAFQALGADRLYRDKKTGAWVCYACLTMKCSSLLCLAFLQIALLPANAQKFLPKNIVFKGAPEYSSQELLAAAGLKKGVLLTSAEMKDHTKLLLDSGLFDNITFTFNGVDLVFSLIPSTSLYNVRIENLPLAPGKELESKLHEKLPLYHGKVPSEGSMLEGIRSALTEMLAAVGIKSGVTVTPYSPTGQDKATAINFRISDSPVQVGSLQIEGVSPAMQAKVQAVSASSAKAPFDTENTAGSLERAFISLYEDEGYAAVKVHAAPSGNPVVLSAAIEVPYTVNIAEGRPYKIGAIHIAPNAFVPQTEIDKAAGVDTDSTVEKIDLHGIWALISSRCKSKGYLDCAVTPNPILDETVGTVRYEVAVKPGTQYHLAFVKFENVSDVVRTHLMRAWQMLPGDPFDAGYISNFVVKAGKEDAFLLNILQNLNVAYTVQTDSQSHEVNCVLKFERKH